MYAQGPALLQFYKHVDADIEQSMKEYDPDTEPETVVQAYVQKMAKNPNLTWAFFATIVSNIERTG